MEALQQNGFDIEGCKQDSEPSPSVAKGVTGKTKQNVQSVHDTSQRSASGWSAFLCAQLGCLCLGMKQHIRDS